MAKSSKPAKPISEKRLAANRANATRSTGPRTPEGKARSAQNSRQHGFAAAAFTVVGLEDVEAIACLRDDLIAVYQPVNSQELFAIKRMALAQLSIMRAAQLEASLFTTGMNDALADPKVYLAGALHQNFEVDSAQNTGHVMAEGFRRLCAAKGNDPWRVFLRYQAQAERNYRRALEEFERLKALRNELPNEPIEEFQPQENSGVDASAPPPFEAARPRNRASLPQLVENGFPEKPTRPDCLDLP